MFEPASKPTFYFIGVTTGASSIMKVFPIWARHLGLGDAIIKGIDFPLHAAPDAYRAAVDFIHRDPLSLGALVTTHKLDLFNACEDMFDVIDPFATLMRETSCISKRDGKLVCHAKDPISSGLALDGFLGPNYFARTSADVFSMGAGGSTIALTWHLMRKSRGVDVPGRTIVSNRSQHRLDEIAHVHAQIETSTSLDYVLAPNATDNDAVLTRLRPKSLIINATGLGKDAPGSPISGAAIFPEGAVVWDLNYRGNLIFLDQARAQARDRGLTVVDGWTYFIHGWTQVIAEVFDTPIGTDAATIDRLTDLALQATKS